MTRRFELFEAGRIGPFKGRAPGGLSKAEGLNRPHR